MASEKKSNLRAKHHASNSEQSKSGAIAGSADARRRRTASEGKQIAQGQGTQTEDEEIGQRPRSIKHHVELARLEDGVPIGCSPAEGSRNAGAKGQEAEGIEEAQDGPDNHLIFQLRFEAMEKPEERPACTRERQWPHERPWNGTREGEVVIMFS